MCWWHKRNLDDSDEQKETLLCSDHENVADRAPSKEEKDIKQQKYQEVLNKYKGSCYPDNSSILHESGESYEEDIITNERSQSPVTSKHKRHVKFKSHLQSSKSLPSPKSHSVLKPNDSLPSKLSKNIAERVEKLEDINAKTVDLNVKTRNYRSLSKKLKEKQAEKLKKSVFSW